jgi:hypothetical protein
MDIELRTYDPDCRLALREFVDQGGTAGYAAWVEVSSYGFAGRQLVGFHASHLTQFVEALAAMDRTLKGTARLTSDYEANYVEVAVGATGGVTVSGELHDYRAPEQLLRFAFHTDQTCLSPFVRQLQAALVVRAI